MPISAADWYDPNPDLRNLYQGDVVDGVPLVFTPAAHVRWVLLRPLPQGPIEGARAGLPRSFRANLDGNLPTAWERPDGELVMVGAASYRVMILSRSCNLDWKKQIQVAPVLPTAGLEEQALASLRENDNAFSFYLPPDGENMPEAYADLSQVATVHVSYLRRTDKLIRRLTSRTTVALQEVIAEYYAKPFGFTIEDEVPQRAFYRCGNCFFEGMDNLPAPLEIDVGAIFPRCERCGDEVLWLKVRGGRA
jgi:hypothetical protein